MLSETFKVNMVLGWIGGLDTPIHTGGSALFGGQFDIKISDAHSLLSSMNLTYSYAAQMCKNSSICKDIHYSICHSANGK